MIVEVLLSCMHLNSDEEVVALAQRTNIKGKAVIVSQCDRNDVVKIGDITIVYTTERGLSKSRNMAMRYSTGDICVICDDDEILADNLESIIVNAYKKYMGASVIAFALIREGKVYPQKASRLGFRQILSTSSVQISFCRADLLKLKIQFDELMGAGTGNGGGEENKFLLDLRKNHCKMIYCPDIIATLLPGESRWFSGYDSKSISDLGWASRRSMGVFVGFMYINYWILTHYGLYKNNISLTSAFKSIFYGFLRE